MSNALVTREYLRDKAPMVQACHGCSPYARKPPDPTRWSIPEAPVRRSGGTARSAGPLRQFAAGWIVAPSQCS